MARLGAKLGASVQSLWHGPCLLPFKLPVLLASSLILLLSPVFFLFNAVISF